jgi:hypothetical protein
MLTIPPQKGKNPRKARARRLIDRGVVMGGEPFDGRVLPYFSEV